MEELAKLLAKKTGKPLVESEKYIDVKSYLELFDNLPEELQGRITRFLSNLDERKKLL